MAVRIARATFHLPYFDADISCESDGAGIAWPPGIAPYDVHLVVLPGRGDAAAALALAPNSLRGRLMIGGQEHFYLEGQIAFALIPALIWRPAERFG